MKNFIPFLIFLSFFSNGFTSDSDYSSDCSSGCYSDYSAECSSECYDDCCTDYDCTSGQWTAWTRVNGEGSNSKDWTRIEGEVFVPLWQWQDSALLFTFIRSSKYARSHLLDVSGGLGLRTIFCSSVIGGVNVSYDGLLTSHNNWFNYLDLGSEVITACIDARVNWRSTMGRRKREFGSGTRVLETFLDDDEVLARTRYGSFERSESSIDGELGYRFCIPFGCIQHGRVYAGGQYCFNSNKHVDVNCASFGIEFYNEELHRTAWGLQFTFGARVCTNFSKRTEGIISLSFRKTASKSTVCCNDPCSSIFARMEDPIPRRIRPCVQKKGGGTIIESLTTDEYPVDGIWVSYAANGNNLQTQIDKALANGGRNTMVFADGMYSGDQFVLNNRQVLAGGNAFLTSRGITSGVAIPWGGWGNETTNPGVLTSTDPSQTLLEMQNQSSVDTLELLGGINGITNASGATNLNIRNATLTALGNNMSPGTSAILLFGADDSLVEGTTLNGGSFDRAGYTITSSSGVRLENISSRDVVGGNFVILSSNTFISGMVSESDGVNIPMVAQVNAWTNINSDGTVFENFLINNSPGDSISSGFIAALGGTAPSNTTIRNGTINNSLEEGIFFGTNTGFDSISNVTINGFASNGIQVGGSASGSFTGITENMAIDNVTIRFNDSANDQAGILIQNNVVNGVKTVSVNNATIIGTGGPDQEGFEIRSQEATSTINLSGTANSVSDVSDFCDIAEVPPVGTINGQIIYNGSSECPPP